MRVEDMRKSTLLLIEAAGLTVTAALLLVIAVSLQLLARLISFDALCPSLAALAFGFLFYVCAAFLTAGTHDQPEHPRFVVANVALHAGFCGAAWLLFRPALTLTWLWAAIGLSALVHTGLYLAARLRVHAVAALSAHAAARPAASVASAFSLRFGVYRAIPLGAALGTALGAAVGAPASGIVRHAAAGVFAVLALDVLSGLLQGGRTLARALVTRAGEGAPALRRRSAKGAEVFELELSAATSSLEAGVAAAAVVADLRRVLRANQLARALILIMSTLTVAALESSSPPALALGLCMLLVALLCSEGASYVGQRRTRHVVLAALDAEERPRAVAALREGARSVRDALTASAGLALAAALGGAAYACALTVVLELTH
jgi:hypothetical protein